MRIEKNVYAGTTKQDYVWFRKSFSANTTTLIKKKTEFLN